MREIILKDGKVALVDDADYENVLQFKWFPHYFGKHYFVTRRSGPANVNLGRHLLNLPSDQRVIYLDGNSLNNCRENLSSHTYRHVRGVEKFHNGGDKKVPIVSDQFKFGGTIKDLRKLTIKSIT